MIKGLFLKTTIKRKPCITSGLIVLNSPMYLTQSTKHATQFEVAFQQSFTMLNKRYTSDEVREIYSSKWNELFEIATQYNSTKLYDPECTHYLIHYHRKLSHLRNTSKKLLEIGIKDGDSLKIWRDYFGNDLRLVGIDIEKGSLDKFELENTTLFFGDQTDYDFLSTVRKAEGRFDVIIDDGGHTQEQLRSTFEYLFKYALNENGLYVMEDLGCSYWHQWSGGLNNKTSAINFLKTKIDDINHRFWKGSRTGYVPKPDYDGLDITFWDANIESISFYKGLCFIQKGDNTYYKS